MLKNLTGLSNSLWITVVVAAFFAVFLSFLLSKSVSAPIKNLIFAIKISSKGNFGHKINVGGLPETRLLMEAYNKMNINLDTLIKENYETKIREKDSYIKALQNQLNPHFLYNTLNIISWLALEGDDRVSGMVIGLSEIMRYTADDSAETSFRDEYDWLQRYLNIMQIRFENMFVCHFDVDEKLFDCKVPKLFLQPIIGNIFVHGFKNFHENDNGSIFIRGYENGHFIVFSVEDNGCGIPAKYLTGNILENFSGTGLRNMDRRIKLLQGEEYGIHIHSGNSQTVVKVVLKKEKIDENIQKIQES